MELEETSENVYTAFVEDEEFILNYMDSHTPSMSVAEDDRDSESVLGKKRKAVRESSSQVCLRHIGCCSKLFCFCILLELSILLGPSSQIT